MFSCANARIVTARLADESLPGVGATGVGVIGKEDGATLPVDIAEVTEASPDEELGIVRDGVGSSEEGVPAGPPESETSGVTLRVFSCESVLVLAKAVVKSGVGSTEGTTEVASTSDGRAANGKEELSITTLHNCL